MSKNEYDHKASRSRLQSEKLSDKHRELFTKARNYLTDFVNSVGANDTASDFTKAALVAYTGMVKELIERIDHELSK